MRIPIYDPFVPNKRIATWFCCLVASSGAGAIAFALRTRLPAREVV